MSMTMSGTGRIPDALTDEDHARPAMLAAMLAKARTDLDTGVKVTSVKIATATMAVPPLSEAEQSAARAAGITPANALRDVSESKAAAADGRSFQASYIRGFMLSSKEFNPIMYERHMAAMKAASPDELIKVVTKTNSERERLTNKEAQMRLDQYMVNDPTVAARVNDTSGGKTVEANRAAELAQFAKLDFNRQRELSMKDGAVVMNDRRDRETIAALSRGGAAINQQLASMGLASPVNMQGKSMMRAGSNANLETKANAAPLFKPRAPAPARASAER